MPAPVSCRHGTPPASRRWRRHDVERRPRRTFTERTQESISCFIPVGELVTGFAAPRGDHGKDEDAAFEQQFLVNVAVRRGDSFGHVGQVELDGPAATGLEIDEHEPAPGAEHVAGVRLAVERLLVAPVITDCPSAGSQGLTEQRVVRLGQPRRVVTVCNGMLRLRHAIREVRHRDVEPPQAGMQLRERGRVFER